MIKPIQNNLVIELHVPDFALAKQFYGFLGFNKVTFEHTPTADEPGYMVLRREDEQGSTMINFYGGNEKVYSQSYFKKFPKDTKRGYATELTIPVKDIDGFFNMTSPLIPNNIQQPVMDKVDGDVKWRDCRIEDPFGFYLRFTELIDWGQ
jgi:hypothetical protein